MHPINTRSFVRLGMIGLAWTAIFAQPVLAQERQSSTVEFAAGVLYFPDYLIVPKPFAGGAARVYVAPRISVGPEITFINGGNHSHLMLTGNITFDFLPESRSRVTPFLVVGGGLFRTREEFRSTRPFTSREGGFTAGGGVRARWFDRVFVGAEGRIGWETHIRLNALIGVRIGGD